MDVSDAELSPPNRQKTDIRIVARFGSSDLSAFFVKVLPDQSIVIGTELSGFQVRRIDHDGVHLEGDENLIDQPHITFHPPGYFHLRADRKPPIFQSLVWTTPEPGKDVTPWLIFISPPLTASMFTGPLRSSSKRKLIWPLSLSTAERSLGLFVDFACPTLASRVPRDPTARFLMAGDVVVRIRAGLVESQPASVRFTAEG